MANTILNPSIIAKAAVRILDNELVMANQVFRGYEDEFTNKVNGYNVGDTISIRKPTDFTVRSGTTASVQDVVEGKETFTVGTVKGVDFSFTSTQLTLNIGELSERVIKPAMVQLANAVDSDLMTLYRDVYNYVGTPGTTVASFAAAARAAERLDLTAVPSDGRVGVLSPTDQWGLAGSQTALYMQPVATPAYRKGSIGDVAGIDFYKSQNVFTHTVGTKAGTPVVNGGAQGVAYTSVLNTESVPGISSLITSGWTASSAILKQGDVFTIANVFAVNPVTKVTLPYLQQFVLQADTSSDGAGAATLSIAPAIITSGAKQTVSAAPANSAAITVLGTAATGYAQNMAFNKNAFGLVVLPMVKPPGAVQVARESYKGLSVRLIPYYTGSTDTSAWRLDVLYGKKTLDPRLACRVAG
jgi:hypothetical protein